MKGPDSGLEKDEAVDILPKCKQGRPLLLGEDLDTEVQECMEAQRAAGTNFRERCYQIG